MATERMTTIVEVDAKGIPVYSHPANKGAGRFKTTNDVIANRIELTKDPDCMIARMCLKCEGIRISWSNSFFCQHCTDRIGYIIQQQSTS